jgi:hypothetical protein
VKRKRQLGFLNHRAIFSSYSLKVMSMRDRLALILSRHGIKEADDSIIEFLLEALNSNTLKLEDKIDWMCETFPVFYTLQPKEVETIIKELCHLKAPLSNRSQITANETKIPSKQEHPIIEEKIFNAVKKVATDMRSALESRNLNGAEVETELVEYLLNFVNEIEVVNGKHCSSGIDDLRDIMISFFTETKEDSVALKNITDILLTANEERNETLRKSTKACLSSQYDSSASSSSSSKNKSYNIVNDSKHNENDTPQTKEDISYLTSMMSSTPEDLITHAYVILCGRNRTETAQYLLDRNDTEGLDKLRLSKTCYDKKERESSLLLEKHKKKMKSTICSKYGELLVREKFNAKGKEFKVKVLLPLQFADIKEKDAKVSWNCICLADMLHV